jgi:hypothetical protein
MNFRSKFLAILITLALSMPLITICAAQTKSGTVTDVTHIDIIPDAKADYL